MPRKSSATARLLRWRARSSRSIGEVDSGSPYSSLSTPRTAMLRTESLNASPMSPYLSESAHVLSLQYPDMEQSTDDRLSVATSAQSSPNYLAVPFLEEEPSSSSETVARRPLVAEQPVSNVAMKLYTRTLKGIESRIRGKQQAQIRPSRCAPSFDDSGSREHQDTRQLSQDISPASDIAISVSTQFLERMPTWLRDERGKFKITRKVFGKAPWHRKESGDSVSSVSGSIREVLQGGTSLATPSSVKTIQSVSGQALASTS